MIRSVDVNGWDSFSIEGFKQDLEEASTHVQKSDLSLTMSALIYLVTAGENPFDQFAARMLLKENIRQARNKGSNERNTTLADVIRDEREEKLVEEMGELELTLVSIMKRANSSTDSRTISPPIYLV